MAPGKPNNSSLPRNMIYVVYGAKWFAQNYAPEKKIWQSVKNFKKPVGSREIRPGHHDRQALAISMIGGTVSLAWRADRSSLKRGVLRWVT